MSSAPDPLLTRRIEYVKKHLRLRDVMTHFGHRPRLMGNMLCCWHDEQSPSARLYDDQDTYWCWVCSPSHGVDQLEFIAIENGYEWDVDPERRLPERKRRAIATILALKYAEEELGASLDLEPWETRLSEASIRKKPGEDPERYWRQMHETLLRQLAVSPLKNRYEVYSQHLEKLVRLKSWPVAEQTPAWALAVHDLSSTVEPSSTQAYNYLPNRSAGAVSSTEQLPDDGKTMTPPPGHTR